MSFLGSIFLLAAVISGVLIPIFVGHGLASHDATVILLALGAGLASAIFVFLYSTLEGRSRRAAPDRHQA